MQSITLTDELSSLIKDFRVQNKKPAKDICTAIDKTPSYLSKVESCSIKKLDVSIFNSLCNAIAGSTEGIKSFIEFAFKKDTEYDSDTSLILSSIDDILYKFIPHKELLDYIKNEINSQNITINDLVTELNSNKELSDLPEALYDSLPDNTYAFTNAEKSHSVIKLAYDYDTILNILENAEETNYVTLEALLYSLYKLSGKSSVDSRVSAIETLEEKFHIGSIRKTKTVVITSREDEEKYLGKLEKTTEEDFMSTIQGIRLALLLSQSRGGSERISTLRKNLKANLGFTFSFISTDIEKILPLSKELKKDFLKDLDKLIDDYANKTDENIDFFFGE